MSSFKGFVVDGSSRQLRRLTLADLPPGEVTIRVEWSSVNFKDALASTPNGRVARIQPIVPGIDLAGRVVDSSDSSVPVDSEALVHGYDLGVARHGGYAEFARVPANWVVPIPPGLSLRDAMVIGTAGYTAALSVIALESHGLQRDSGPVLVLGTTGGVGSMAAAMLKARGYEVWASTGKASHPLLAALEIDGVITRDEALMESTRPLESQRWAACVDPVGGRPLAYALRTLRQYGCVASCGNVGGAELHTTVFPFILRGVSLIGIDSVQTPINGRREVWNRLAGDLRPQRLLASDWIKVVRLEDLDRVLSDVLQGKGVGRTVVRVAPERR